MRVLLVAFAAISGCMTSQVPTASIEIDVDTPWQVLITESPALAAQPPPDSIRTYAARGREHARMLRTKAESEVKRLGPEAKNAKKLTTFLKWIGGSSAALLLGFGQEGLPSKIAAIASATGLTLEALGAGQGKRVQSCAMAGNELSHAAGRLQVAYVSADDPDYREHWFADISDVVGMFHRAYSACGLGKHKLDYPWSPVPPSR